MAIIIKNSKEIELMRAACAIVGETLAYIETKIEPDISTGQLDKLARDFILSKNAVPTFKGYRGYPGNICISLNEEVIHGIPGIRRLKNGDIVSIDIGATYEGFIGDAARTFICGDVSEDIKKLVRVTKESFFEGIKFAKAGLHLYQISAAVQKHVEDNGLSVVKEFVGHGVGRKLHEAPEIPNYKMPSRGPRLSAGMTLAIEPMVNLGGSEVIVQDDEWTVVTKDGKYSSHYENTILITEGEPEILTL